MEFSPRTHQTDATREQFSGTSATRTRPVYVPSARLAKHTQINVVVGSLVGGASFNQTDVFYLMFNRSSGSGLQPEQTPIKWRYFCLLAPPTFHKHNKHPSRALIFISGGI